MLEVARESIPAALFEASGEDIERALGERAASFVLTYRPGGLSSRPSEEDPELVEWVLPLEASVDRRALREFLAAQGWSGTPAARASVTLCVSAASDGVPGGRDVLADLQRYLSDALGARDLLLLEPGLRRGAGTCGAGPDAGALSVARAIGADVGVDVEVDWRPQTGRSGVRGGVADVNVRASRAADGAALALSRFQGAGYHAQAERALSRALEAVRDQVVDNVVLQLSRNWTEVARGEGPVEVRLLEVGNLTQVEAVRAQIVARLGARHARIVELAPREAALEVVGRLSPGALSDRLTALVFDDFSLEPLAVDPPQIALRIHERPLELDEP